MKKHILEITSTHTSSSNVDNPVRSLKIRRPSKLMNKVVN